MTLCFVVMDLRMIAILKSVPLSFLDYPFGFSRMEVVLYFARFSGTKFIGWPSVLSSRLFIYLVYALCSYPKSFLVQYAIMSQLED